MPHIILSPTAQVKSRRYAVSITYRDWPANDTPYGLHQMQDITKFPQDMLLDLRLEVY